MPLPTCRDMSELATGYMEGALPWRVRFAAWRHLRLCSMCRAYYDQLAKLRRIIGRITLPGPSLNVEEAMLAARREVQDGPA
jgi:predicted anti-sigma-YlaC factor YlaD